MSTTEPTVGRIVHYHGSHGLYPFQQPIAAIITEVFPPAKDQPRLVRLDIRWPSLEEPDFTGGRIYPYSDQPAPGHWNWPPRDDAPVTGITLQDAE